MSITAKAVLLSFDFKIFILTPFFNKGVGLSGEVLHSVAGEVIEVGDLHIGPPSADPGDNGPLWASCSFPFIIIPNQLPNPTRRESELPAD
jgi:hypothetical protein